MNSEDAQELLAHIQGIAKILDKNTDKTDLASQEAIEKSVRQQMLEHVSPQARISHKALEKKGQKLPKCLLHMNFSSLKHDPNRIGLYTGTVQI